MQEKTKGGSMKPRDQPWKLRDRLKGKGGQISVR